MLYLLQVTSYTAAMLLVYLLFIRNRPVYQFSRFYLIICGVLPLIIPLIRFPERVVVPVAVPVQATESVIATKEIIITGVRHIDVVDNSLPIFWLIYGAVGCIIAGLHIYRLYGLARLIRKSAKRNCGYYTVIESSGYGPGSFGRCIFFPGTEINETILAHEQAHVRLHHTLDNLFLSFLQAATWPNIFIIWIRKEIKEVHEFQADSFVNADDNEYAGLLLSSVFNTNSFPEMHTFFGHTIKRRLRMLRKRTISTLRKAYIGSVAGIFAVILILVIVAIQGCKRDNAEDKLVSAKVPVSDAWSHTGMTLVDAVIDSGYGQKILISADDLYVKMDSSKGAYPYMIRKTPENELIIATSMCEFLKLADIESRDLIPNMLMFNEKLNELVGKYDVLKGALLEAEKQDSDHEKIKEMQVQRKSAREFLINEFEAYEKELGAKIIKMRQERGRAIIFAP